MSFFFNLDLGLIGVLAYALAFLLALTVIVFIHEFGHFQVARWCGVSVEAFSIGFGREILGWTDRHGTRWKIGWLPLGGFVKFEGDSNAASMPEEMSVAESPVPRRLSCKKIWQRAAVVIAGPIANFLLAIAIFTLSAMLIGIPINEPRVDGLVKGGVAEQSGLRPGDFVRTIDGRVIDSFYELAEERSIPSRREDGAGRRSWRPDDHHRTHLGGTRGEGSLGRHDSSSDFSASSTAMKMISGSNASRSLPRFPTVSTEPGG